VNSVDLHPVVLVLHYATFSTHYLLT